MAPLYEKNQYFPKDIVQLGRDEVFVDCGAYVGDTAESFIAHIKEQNASYKKIISLEPDPINFEALRKNKFEDHECLNLGCADKKGVIRFTMVAPNSHYDENGEIAVKVDTLDDIIKDKVTFIKMDIEGMELASLKGAERIIKQYKPKLAICIYHKIEDLWEIQNYIKSIVPDYKFYIRAHDKYAIELVLYAVV